tara:strand:- start:165 stop:446 length:282 start_codon:yes stop_codon:yes gene_type:complete
MSVVERDLFQVGLDLTEVWQQQLLTVYLQINFNTVAILSSALGCHFTVCLDTQCVGESSGHDGVVMMAVALTKAIEHQYSGASAEIRGRATAL